MNEMDLAVLTLCEFAAESVPNAASDQAASTGSKTVGSKTVGSRTAQATLRRCRTREHGIALMTIGHAIEYLLQSRLIAQQTTTGAEREALGILLSANLSVYSEGAEVVPLKARLRRWLHGTPIKHDPAIIH